MRQSDVSSPVQYDRLNQVVAAIFDKSITRNKTSLAKHLGYSLSYFSTVLSGKSKISAEFLDKMEALFKVSREFIEDGDGPMFLTSDDVPNSSSDKRKKCSNQLSQNANNILLEVVGTLKEQIAVKDKQIERLLDLLQGVK
jgi:transcriptional regulator with XRE-family HTH domain